MTATLTPGEISAMLAARAEALARELLPDGRKVGAEWRAGSLAGEAGQSLGVHLAGAKAGVWSEFNGGGGGDALDLVAEVLFRGEKAPAIKWAKAWLGLDGADANAVRQHRRAVREKSERQAAEAEKDQARRLRRARGIWFHAAPTLRNTPVDLYLKGRGLDLARLCIPGSDAARQPGALRYASRCWEPESRRELPAMVAAISGADGQLVAVHRTWLTSAEKYDGRGAEEFQSADTDAPVQTRKIYVKAPISAPKKTLGRYSGGCVRLWRGASAKRLSKAPRGDTAVIVEGIEDGLAVAMLTPQFRVLVAVALANMANIELPPAISTVILAADNDTPSSATGHAALDRAIARYRAEGRDVRIARSPAGKDFADGIQMSDNALEHEQ